MSLKEEFMKIITYEEWDKRRYEFKGLDAGDMGLRYNRDTEEKAW